MRYIHRQVLKTLNPLKRQGSRKAKKEEVQKNVRFVNWIAERNNSVKTIENLGLKHVEQFLRNLAAKGRSISTQTKYFTAIKKLWEFSDKNGDFDELRRTLSL